MPVAPIQLSRSRWTSIAGELSGAKTLAMPNEPILIVEASLARALRPWLPPPRSLPRSPTPIASQALPGSPRRTCAPLVPAPPPVGPVLAESVSTSSATELALGISEA